MQRDCLEQGDRAVTISRPPVPCGWRRERPVSQLSSSQAGGLWRSAQVRSSNAV